MKKLIIISLMLFAGITVFTGCKKDEEAKPGPTISFSGSSAKVIDFAVTGDNRIVFNATVAAEGEISTFTLTKKIYGTSTTSSQLTATGYAKQTSWTYNFDQTFAEADFAGVSKIEFIFACTDAQDPALSVEKIFTVTKKAATVLVPISSYGPLTLESAFSAPTTAEYVNALTGVTYNHAGANSNTSTFGFVSGGATNGATFFGSGFDFVLTSVPATWATAAKFATTTLTIAEFDAISTTDETVLLSKIPATLTLDKINLLQDGAANASVEVFAFVVGGKKGLVKIPASLNNTAAQTVSITIKVQQ